MFVHVLDHRAKTVFTEAPPPDVQAFLRAIKPFREDLVVRVECMFAWHRLADLRESEQITFALGLALAMRLIHRGKAKADPIDAGKLAVQSCRQK